jgi:hypothetical protein
MMITGQTPVIAEAEAGDAGADALLRDVAITQLPSLPPRLAKYVGGLLADRERRKRHGAPDEFDRDICIHHVVWKIVQTGFKPTRNEVSELDSACSIVAKALTKLGVPFSEKNVQRIWGKISKHYPVLQK